MMNISESSFSLKNSKILVTGASSGIGREIAIVAAKHGAIIYAVGRNKEKLNALEKVIGNKNCKIFSVDLTNNDQILRFIDEIDNIDGLVNCAGLIKMSPYKFITQNSFSEIFNINVEAPLFLTTTLLKRRKINNASSIVFISSAGLFKYPPGDILSVAPKATIEHVLKGIAKEEGKNGVRANSIALGVIDTGIFHRLREENNTFLMMHGMKPL